MCGPAAMPMIASAGYIAQAGLGIMGAINQQNADARAVAQHNYNVGLNAQSAGISASNQYADIGKSFTYEARSAQSQAQQAIEAGRGAQGTAVASAGSSGFTGSSLTLGAVMSDIDRKNADTERNYELKVDDLKDAYRSKGRSIQSQAQDRINQMSFQSAPDGSALGLNIANSLVKGASGVAGAFK